MTPMDGLEGSVRMSRDIEVAVEWQQRDPKGVEQCNVLLRSTLVIEYKVHFRVWLRRCWVGQL